MAGPLAEKIAQALARRHPDACNKVFKDVEGELTLAENTFGVLTTRTIALARDSLVEDEKKHDHVGYAYHHGRVGDTS